MNTIHDLKIASRVIRSFIDREDTIDNIEHLSKSVRVIHEEMKVALKVIGDQGKKEDFAKHVDSKPSMKFLHVLLIVIYLVGCFVFYLHEQIEISIVLGFIAGGQCYSIMQMIYDLIKRQSHE